jgi:ABC-type multidrug transport system ATPase subunit
MPPILKLDSVGRRFSGRWAVAGVSLTIAAGEIHALVGPNGSGKSTLARLAAGLLRPHAGTVRIDGEDPREAEGARGRVGYLGHAPILYGDLTPEENLAFVGRLYRVEPIAAAIAESFGVLGVGAERATPVRALSRGMVQRVGLARSLLHQPRLVIWDEPFSGLDLGSITRVVAAVESARAGGAGVLLISHDLVELWRLTATIQVMTAGSIRFTADTSQPIDSFRARYRATVDG